MQYQKREESTDKDIDNCYNSFTKLTIKENEIFGDVKSNADDLKSTKKFNNQLFQPFVANKVMKSTLIFGDEWHYVKHDSRWFQEVDENL